jgi:DNA-dependent RNA polymerase auxiliary subunit epsilon
MKKKKLKTYQVTQVLHVVLEIEAYDETHLEEKVREITNAYCDDPNSQPDYQHAIAQSEYEIENIEAVEVEDDRKPDRKGRLN